MRADRKIQNRAIQRFVKNNTRKNKARNVILVIAVVLVTILMTVMFGAGSAYFITFSLQISALREQRRTAVFTWQQRKKWSRFPLWMK